MKTDTNKKAITFKLLAESVIKAWLAVTLVIICLHDVKTTYLAMFWLALIALLNNKNPLYLGINEEKVKKSRIIKIGLPMAILLGGLPCIARCF